MTKWWRAGFPGGNPSSWSACFFRGLAAGAAALLLWTCSLMQDEVLLSYSVGFHLKLLTSPCPILQWMFPAVVQLREPSHPKKVIPSSKIFHLFLYIAERENMPLCGVFPENMPLCGWRWNVSWAKSTFTTPALPSVVGLNGCFQRTMRNVCCFLFFPNCICCREPSSCLPLLLI